MSHPDCQKIVGKWSKVTEIDLNSFKKFEAILSNKDYSPIMKTFDENDLKYLDHNCLWKGVTYYTRLGEDEIKYVFQHEEEII